MPQAMDMDRCEIMPSDKVVKPARDGIQANQLTVPDGEKSIAVLPLITNAQTFLLLPFTKCTQQATCCRGYFEAAL